MSINNIDFHYCVDVDYDKTLGCICGYCDYIIRCSKILHPKVENICEDTFCDRLKDFIPKGDIYRYCFEWFIKNANRKNVENMFDVDVCGGYYGEEIDSVYLERFFAEDIEKFIEKMKKCPIHETIEDLLKEEYGYVLPQIRNKDWKSDKISMKNIRFTENKECEEKIIQKYKYREPSCLCQKKGEKYQIIDGRHRYKSAQQRNKRKILTIWCE